MWWAVAAAALPYVVSAMQGKPKRPQAPAQARLTNRDAQMNQIMDTAFNPNSNQYSLASEMAAEQVNRVLARSGMGGSSAGAQMQSNTQAQMAQAWLENQAQRQQAAMQTVTAYDQNQQGVNQQGNNAAYNYAMDGYKDAQQRNANQVQGISNMVNAGVGAYNQNRMMTSYEQMIKQGQTPQQPNQTTVIQPTYGSPSPESSPYAPGGAYAPTGAYTMFPTR